MQIGRLAARAVIGSLFVGHGTQKLFGWFGGPGLEGTEQMMGALEMRPTRANALAAGVSETAGGALLIAGAATPLAASSLIGTMITAIRKVHQPKGPWAAEGGWEYNAVLMASIFAIVERRSGLRWALASLAAGAGGALVASELASRQPAPQPAEGVVEATEQPVPAETRVSASV